MSNNRISWISLSLGFLALGLVSQASASMNVELLRANFNDKPLNTQIGTGGAIVGEPVSVPTDLIAKVQAAPFSTPSLHLTRNNVAARFARFDFIGGEEVHSGALRISFTVRTPPALSAFRVSVSDQVTATATFAGLDFRTDGSIFTLDTPLAISTYAPNKTLRVEYVFQVVAGTYDLFINGDQKLDDRIQGNATNEKGIGVLFFGFPTGTSTGDWAVDDIHVVRTPALLNADFDNKPLGLQIGTGGAVVGEPITVDAVLMATVETGFFVTPALRLQHSNPGSVNAAFFAFVNSAEITDGELRISFRLRTAPVTDSFQFLVRERGTAGLGFGGLRFESNGGITALDANGSVGGIGGGYMPGDTLLIEFRYALTAGTYDVYINRVLALDDRAHGVSAVGRGVGSVILATTNLTSSPWVFDDLYVYQPVDVVFQDGFDD